MNGGETGWSVAAEHSAQSDHDAGCETFLTGLATTDAAGVDDVNLG